jgi:aryl-alcohol dehydrogenase-like predicted oxidoreductase
MDHTVVNGIDISKLTLGTAQLGLNYGVTNINGKPDRRMSIEILNVAASHGVNCFDTAPSYGDSEEILGCFLSSRSDTSELPIVVTKLPPINLAGKVTVDSVYHLVRKHITKSVARLHIEKIPIYLLHRASDIDIYDGLIIRSLSRLKDEGLIEILGVSVYSPEEVEHALEISIIKAIQVPINIFDHRLIKRGLLDQLKDKNFIVFARSIFLQGLFFFDPDNLPPRLELAKKPLRQLYQLSHAQEIGIAEMALTFVRDLPGITSLIIGAETPNQVQEDVDLVNSAPLSSELRGKIMSTFSDLPPELINPSLWNLNR